MRKNVQTEQIRKMTLLAILTAIVFVLQFFFSSFRLGTFSIATVLLPIVIGAACCGPWAGAWLGLVFSITVFLSGDANFFLSLHITGTIVTVIAKSVLAGFLSGLAYRAFEKCNRFLAVVISAVVCPVVNTAVFFLGCCVFFMNEIGQFATADGVSALYYILTMYIGLNFVFELLFNIILCPVIYKLLYIRKH